MTILEPTTAPAKPAFRQRLATTLRQMRKARWPYFFIAPFFLLYLVFGFFPQVFSIVLSLSKWTGLGSIDFIGLANFKLAFTDRVFWQSMLNSVIMFFLHVPVMLLLALVLAVLLSSNRVKGYQFFRLVVFLPYITNKIAAGRTFQLLFSSTDSGLINSLLQAIGLGSVTWMENAWTARIVLAIMLIWGWVGYNMILMLAGLQTINPELQEAAQIDGATPIQAFFYITIPLMRPIILFCVVMSVMGTFSMFSEVYSLTAVGGGVGGPMNATITPLIYMYNKAFGDFRMGYAAAIAYLYFFFIFIITLLQFRRYGRVDQ
jgi:lactose/L-arabinose transport system permease protein